MEQLNLEIARNRRAKRKPVHLGHTVYRGKIFLQHKQVFEHHMETAGWCTGIYRINQENNSLPEY